MTVRFATVEAFYAAVKAAIVGVPGTDAQVAAVLNAQRSAVWRDVPARDARQVLYASGAFGRIDDAQTTGAADVRAAARQFMAMLREDVLLASEADQRAAIVALLAPLITAAAMTVADRNALVALAQVQEPVWDRLVTDQDVARARLV